jgi:hypothetical protein
MLVAVVDASAKKVAARATMLAKASGAHLELFSVVLILCALATQGWLVVSLALPVVLQELSKRSRISMAAYLREAVEDLLAKYEEPKKRSTK